MVWLSSDSDSLFEVGGKENQIWKHLMVDGVVSSTKKGRLRLQRQFTTFLNIVKVYIGKSHICSDKFWVRGPYLSASCILNNECNGKRTHVRYINQAVKR